MNVFNSTLKIIAHMEFLGWGSDVGERLVWPQLFKKTEEL